MTNEDEDRDIEAFIGSIDPADMRDAKHLREIAAAREAGDEDRLREAVGAARAAGDPWTAISVPLQTSERNARRKYGES